MSMIPPRETLALTVDGGGIRGLLVAQALTALEGALGGKPLIEHPNVKILSGTSTGAQIAAGIALGLTAAEITDLYISGARTVFPLLFPEWLPPRLVFIFKSLIGLFFPSLYSGENQKQLYRQMIGQKTGNPDLTLGELNQRLRPDQVLILTTVDINERRTHFLKTYDPDTADWPLWQAVMASAAAPSTLPVVSRAGRYYTDGGAGSYGNPAYIVAREAITWRGCAPADVSIFSFGTGWVNDVNFERAHRPPDTWRILDWATNAPFLILDDVMRAESVDLISSYVHEGGLDFRRFQIELEEDIALDDTRDATLAHLRQLGQQMGQRILNNQHALGTDPSFDPEGLRQTLARQAASIERARTRAK